MHVCRDRVVLVASWQFKIQVLYCFENGSPKTLNNAAAAGNDILISQPRVLTSHHQIWASVDCTEEM